jgi:hypothetical protein
MRMTRSRPANPARTWTVSAAVVVNLAASWAACAGRVAPQDSPAAAVSPPVDAGPRCGPTPVEVVDFNPLVRQFGLIALGAMPIAMDATNIYFPFGRGLMRAPIQGGAVTTLTTFDFTLPSNVIVEYQDLIVKSSSAFLHTNLDGNDDNDEQILSVPAQGGSAVSLATSHGVVQGFAADANTVYFVDSDGIQSVPQSGGNVRVLTSTTGEIAVVGANIVVTTPDGNVLAVPIQGGSPTTLATGQGGAKFPLACGSDVCWYFGGSEAAMGPTGPGYIAHLAGGNISTISASPPADLVFDGTDFFETVPCDTCSGALVRLPISGAAPVTMAPGAYVVVDDECAYFSVVEGAALPSSSSGGPSGIYSVEKSYTGP